MSRGFRLTELYLTCSLRLALSYAIITSTTDLIERHGMKRIVVVGSTGSGKTTLAATLASRLDLRHIELDALHWDAGWTPAPKDTFRARTSAALAVSDRWVVDGNYSAVRDLVWDRADTLVWLDYRLPLLFWRLARRTLVRVYRKEELWNGNREDLRTHLFSRDSLFLWLVTSYGPRRREFPKVLARPELGHLEVYRFRSPRKAEEWLQQCTAASSYPTGH